MTMIPLVPKSILNNGKNFSFELLQIDSFET